MTVDLRKATEEDISRFRECLNADPEHAKQIPDEWVSKPGEFLVFYDEKGNRVWARVELAVRVSIQHDQKVSPLTTANILDRGLRWILGRSRNLGYTEVIFESRAPRLIQFFQKRFGFVPVKENYKVSTTGGALFAAHQANRKI